MNVFIDLLIANRKSSIDQLQRRNGLCSISELREKEVTSKLDLFIYEKAFINLKGEDGLDFESEKRASPVVQKLTPGFRAENQQASSSETIHPN